METPKRNRGERDHRDRPSWHGWLGVAGAVFLGAVLLFAAYAKLLDPEAFARQIESEGLDLVLSARAVAFVALGLEIALGLALVLGIRRRWVLVPAAGLVLLFVFLTGRSYVRSLAGVDTGAEGCGCFGALVERTPAEAFWQDLLLLVPPLILAFFGRSRRAAGDLWPRRRLAAVAALTAAALVFAVYAPVLPLDDLATRLKPGKGLADLCSGRDEERICLAFLLPEAREGSHLVVLADLEDERFAEAVGRLNEHALSYRLPQLWVLTASPPEVKDRFYWTHAPAFEIRELPSSLMTLLVRRLPRSFVVENGEVTATYPGLGGLDSAES